MSGWQVTLSIAADPGTTGTLTFNSPVGPTSSEPVNYVLAGINFGILATNSLSELLAFDVNEPFSGGIQVPTAPGANLLEIHFEASPNAQGTFGVFALPGYRRFAL